MTKKNKLINRKVTGMKYKKTGQIMKQEQYRKKEKQRRHEGSKEKSEKQRGIATCGEREREGIMSYTDQYTHQENVIERL